MAAILRDSTVVVAVVRTRPRAIPLSMINHEKIHTWVSFSYMVMGLRLAALRAAGAPLIYIFRTFLHGGGVPQVGEGNPPSRGRKIARVYMQTKLLTTPGSQGEVSGGFCVVAKHVNRENGGRTTHFGGQCSFPLTSCSRCNISLLWHFFFFVFFADFFYWRACKCNMNSTPARRVTPR